MEEILEDIAEQLTKQFAMAGANYICTVAPGSSAFQAITDLRNKIAEVRSQKQSYFEDNCRLRNIVEAQRNALLHWRREFDREFGKRILDNLPTKV